MTGVEVDAALADRAAAWTRGNDRFRVLNASALDIPLSDYTHFYLFNPFDSDVLVRFLDAIESQVRRRVVLIHMSDNGEWLAYLGRPGWLASRGGGRISHAPIPRGWGIPDVRMPAALLYLGIRSIGGGRSARLYGIKEGVVQARSQSND